MTTVDLELARLRYLERVSEALFNDFLGLIGPTKDFPVHVGFLGSEAERVRAWAAILEFRQALTKQPGEFSCAGSERTQTAEDL